MTQELIQSAIALADTLAEENRALDRLEFAHALSLLEAKMRATSAFIAAQAHAASAVPEARAHRQPMEATAARLRDLAAENKRLLERAIIVQRRVIGCIVGALPRSESAPRYGASGAFAGRHVRPMALSARA